jgi:hypothetical protein
MDVVIGSVLLSSVVLSVLLVVAGLLWRWINTGQLGVQYTIARMNLFEFVVAEVRDVVRGAFRHRLSPRLAWYPTEFSRVNFQYNFDCAQHLPHKNDNGVCGSFMPR